MNDLLTRELRSIESVKGPLLFVKSSSAIAYGGMVSIIMDDGQVREGQIVEASENGAVIQVFGPTERINPEKTTIRFHEEAIKLDLSPLCLGRVFSGSGEPLDGLSAPAPLLRRGVIGSAINPLRRALPRDFLQTGISSIDGLNTLVRGQKLPIFSGAGLPANEIANFIISNAGLGGEDGGFALVFAGMGITFREADFFRKAFESTGAIEHSVVYMNLADDPVIERLLTPRFALTMAEYLAFELEMHTLVVMTDMTHYCNALREISSAMEEIPGRRGYPGYMYTDLAELYERAGKIKGREGSITLVPILTMPDDDITHPIPDLTGYITEGQIVLDRDLFHKGCFPPINPMPSLSRLMNHGIGEGRTREDHRQLADQLYMLYARGIEQRRVASIIGEEGLSAMDRKYLSFAEEFERVYIGQGTLGRSIEETLTTGWRLLNLVPQSELVRIKKEMIEKYRVGEHSDGGAEKEQD